MENAAYVAVSRQMILRRELDVVANNIANADTPGFKTEALMVETDTQAIPGATGPLANLQFVIDSGLARDFSQGELIETGGPLDVAIEGDGFFQIQTEDGPRFTRDGRFHLDGEGRLVNFRGEPVSGDIQLDPALGQPTIATDGTITQGGEVVGRLEAFRFAALGALEKRGDGLYANIGNQAPEAAPDVLLRQGMIESSNVQAILEVTKMIEVSREYERIARMIEQTAQLERTAIERLGRVS